MNHRPPHLFINESWYFITAHTSGKSSIFFSEEHKSIWLETFNTLVDQYAIETGAWVLLDNHYHILCFFKNTHIIPSFMKRLHGATSLKLNHLDGLLGREVWYSYWDRIIRSDSDYWTKFNYIHYNPVKHGYVNKPDLWKHSSYQSILENKGEDWLADCWASYPILEYDFEC